MTGPPVRPSFVCLSAAGLPEAPPCSGSEPQRDCALSRQPSAGCGLRRAGLQLFFSAAFASFGCGRCSPLGLVALDAAAALHHVLEGAELGGVLALGGAENALRRSSILRDGLLPEAAPHVVRLVLVKLFGHCLARSRLWQRPARHILLFRGVGGVLGGVATRAD